jgi:hypothetical protein
VAIPLIAWSNISAGFDEDQSVDWSLVAIALGMLAGGLLLVEVCRRWFNFMLGSSDCRWRMTK